MEQPTIQTTLLEMFVEYVLPLIGALLAYLTAKVMAALKTKLDSETSKNLIDKVEILTNIIGVVASRTLIAEMRAASADGVITKEEVNAIIASVYSHVMDSLTERDKKLMSEIGADATTLVMSIIRTRVESLISINQGEHP